MPSELVIELERELENAVHQSVYDVTEKTNYELHEHLTLGSCMDGYPPPPQISSQDLRLEYSPEPATQSVIITDVFSEIIPDLDSGSQDNNIPVKTSLIVPPTTKKQD